VTALTEIRNAVIGWLDLLGGRPDAAARFNGTRSGLFTMLGVYLLLVVITRTIQVVALFGQPPGLADLLVTLVVNSLPLLGIYLVILGTVRFLQPQVTLLELMVPAGYALSLVLAIGLPLTLFAGNIFSAAMQGVMGYMLYRLARGIGKFPIGISAAFAILTVMLLVAIPMALYMLVQPDLPTPA